jgi:undecaprenyl-diphosphatase
MKTSNKNEQTITSSILFSLLVVVSLASFFIDEIVLAAMPSVRVPILDTFFFGITHIGIVAALFILVPFIALLIRKQSSEAIYLLTAAASSLLIGILLKMAVASQRPTQDLFTFFGPIVHSFPSLHALLVFAMVPILSKNFPKMRYVVWILASLVALSRLYFGVHYVSDVVWGILLGFGIGWYIAQDHSESKLRVTPFELRRKAFHTVFGTALTFLIYFNHLNALRLGVLLVIGLALSFIERKARLPVLSTLLDIFERSGERKTFPARGMLMFIAGAFLAVLLFPKNIALASLMILTFGDCAAHLFGVQFGRVKNPLSEHRFIEGAFAGIIAGFFGALFFVSPLHAIVASVVAMMVEAVEFNIPSLQVDDNVLVPLIAGASLLLISIA